MCLFKLLLSAFLASPLFSVVLLHLCFVSQCPQCLYKCYGGGDGGRGCGGVIKSSSI